MATRGRPFEPGNKCGRGRPRGSRNKTSAAAQDLLEKYAEPVTKKCIAQALQGNPKSMQLCMDRIVPSRRELPVKIGPMPTQTLADVSQASELVIRKVASGLITPTQGQALAELIEGRRRVLETQELSERLGALEAQSKCLEA